MLQFRLLFLFGFTLLTSHAEDLVETIKNSTAFLSIPATQNSGTTFCISAKGYFATCAHVLGNAPVGSEVNLTIRSGLPEAKEGKATVVRIDADNDLAILKAEPEFAHPLPLARTPPRETDEVTVGGYPFGTALALEKRPAITIATGKVTALRREGSLLSRIQFDADIQFGNSGGPLLNENGKVIGVVASRITGSKLSFALGTSLLNAVINGPMAKVENLTELTSSKKNEPFSLDLVLDYLTPPSEAPEVVATFTGSASGVRPLEVKKTGKYHYHLSGIPYPGDSDTTGRTLRTKLVRISGNITSAVTVAHKDLEFSIGGENYFLSQFKLIYPPKKKGLTVDGKVIEGPITGLESVAPLTRDHPMQAANFQNWPIVTIRPDGFTRESLKLEIKIRDGAMVRTLAKNLSPPDPGGEVSHDFLPAPPPGIARNLPETSSRKLETITFPAEITDVAYGGNGRYVAILLSAENSCHIIDGLSAEVIHKIPATPDSKIAAGLQTLFIANSDGLSAWSLADGNSLFRDKACFDGPVQDLAVGTGSDRFLAVIYRAYERTDMIRVELRSQKDGRILAIEPTDLKVNAQSLISISERGTTIGLHSPPPARFNQGILVLRGGRYQSLQLGGSGWLKPGPKDETILSGQGRIGLIPYGFGGRQQEKQGYGLLPTTHEGLALAVPVFPERGPASPGSFGLFDITTGHCLVPELITSEGFSRDPNASPGFRSGSQDFPTRLPWDERFFYSVVFGHLFAIPSDNRRLIIHPIQLHDVLDRQGRPYLLVESDAPTQLTGPSFKAQLQIVSSENKPTFEILVAPPGFTISKDGVISGKIPPTDGNEAKSLLILVKTQSLERYWRHTFHPDNRNQ